VNCPECGEPMGDFSPCACALDAPRPVRKPRPANSDGMRAMVARKLARKERERLEKGGVK
jgi:hypothetical protein